ncbi:MULTISPECIES: hypothetical protein [unclassified Nostoc]|uniref:hypothetical protein n=1 Tax=unclassified Nostoc TaxID=2593658 RepID=UPI002AD3603C|nr:MULTISPECIES: hypothetical protein [unclassified Nostoc]MDZ8123103.1 hypothetical protein [Nostoc sp. CmiVER01]MDZ8224603.1 hypothetical protein [Nostoc sp. ChiVER01]
MTQPNAIRQQQAQRILELFAIARQRYLDAGGNPRHTPRGLKGDDYMTDEERQEALVLGRKIFPQEYIDNTARSIKYPPVES